MLTLFLISCGALIAVLLSSLLIKTPAKWFRALLAGVAACMVFFLIALCLQRVFKGIADFVNPWALLLVILPAGLLIAKTLWKQSFTPRLVYSRTAVLAGGKNLRAALTEWLPNLLYALALTLLVVALARPVSVDRTILPPTEGIDIILLMDVSASMQRQDFYPNRFTAAIRTADNFVQKRLNDRIGLVVFSRAAMLQAPLTLDHEAIRELLGALYLGIIDPNYTAIGDGLGVATAHLKDSQAKSKVIILLTDGANNAGSIDPRLAAKAAQAYGIKVYTVATASPPGSGIFSSNEEEIDESLLLEIANETGGKFYRAKNEMELSKIYNTINELEKTEFTQSIQTSQSDFYLPFVLAGLLCLGLGILLEKLILIRVP